MCEVVRFPDGNIDMKETEKEFVAALSQCKDQTPLLVFKMAAALAQADKQHKTACKAAGVDHQELSSACYRMVFGHQGSTTTTAPGLGHQAYQPPSTVGSSAVRSFDVEVRKELVKAKVDLTADSDKQVRAEYRQSMINDDDKILIPVIKRMIQGLSDANDKDAAALVGLLDPASTSGRALSNFEDNYMYGSAGRCLYAERPRAPMATPIPDLVERGRVSAWDLGELDDHGDGQPVRRDAQK